MKKVISALLCLTLILSLSPAVFAEEERSFIHPGLLHTALDLSCIAEEIANGSELYVEGFKALTSSKYAQSSVTARAAETIVRGGNGQNFAQLYEDCAKAYQNALRYHLEGNEACGKTACDILNAWSEKLKTVTGNADRYLAAGLYGYQIANAAELMRDYPGFEKERMQQMLINVFYKPLCERFLVSNEFGRDHNDAYITNYWANWDLANMAATVAIGIFCDREDIYQTGISYFVNGAGNGSIYNAIPHLFDGSVAQWQESGRDQGHSNLGIGLMATICEMAWNQGDDLYSYAGNRFMYAAEYVAGYNNGVEMPFELYEWGTGGKGEYASQNVVSNAGRGEMRPVWAMIYNHYANRMGYDMPNVKKRIEIQGIEYGPGGHASTFDQTGFGTLLYSHGKATDKKAAPLPAPLEEGVYKIKPRHSGKYIAEKDGLVAQYSEGGNNEWLIAHLGGGVYTITNSVTGNTLGIENSSHEPLAKVVSAPYTAENSQKFAFIKTADGYWRITATHASKALDVLNASQNEGEGLIQYRYLTTHNQQFTFELVESKDVTPPADTNEGELYVTVNGVRTAGDVSPVIENGRMLVPLRQVFEKMGATVEWDDTLKTATCTLGETQVRVTLNSQAATIGDQVFTLDAAPALINNRILVPVRFIAEGLGATVTWRNETKTAEILK
ncbi:MAG: RICIN domain-containing protein [Clostridia bacterium]|nr:RICIN domain-containing protein [Clostridia bacterium]